MLMLVETMTWEVRTHLVALAALGSETFLTASLAEVVSADQGLVHSVAKMLCSE
jgi:hypothetical protein